MMSHNPVWYRQWYLTHKIAKQLQSEDWDKRHPGYRQAYNRAYYLRRKQEKKSWVNG